jgi:hypothetical protein
MLGNWMPSSRDRFTAADFAFLTEVLVPGERRARVTRLWHDPEALTQVLDLNEVFRALLDSPTALEVSAPFYFYVLVRHAFVQSGLTDDALADYVGGVLADQIPSQHGGKLIELAKEIAYAADFLTLLEASPGRLRFYLQVAAGNQFLVLAGMYSGFLERRAERRGAPGVEFYEAFARHAFRGAADNRQAPADAPRELLGELSEVLPHARRSLNRMAEEFVFLGE